MSISGLPLVPDGAETTTARKLAEQLGVDYELIEGLVVGKQIRGYRSVGRSGHEVVLVDLAEVARLTALTGRRGGAK